MEAFNVGTEAWPKAVSKRPGEAGEGLLLDQTPVENLKSHFKGLAQVIFLFIDDFLTGLP
jgi:hypothetical protein